MTTKGPDEKFCGDCGEAIKIRAEICPKCGVRQVPEKSASTGGAKNKVVAALLAIFLGGIGVHKFYLGSNGWGVIYLLFCWTFIPTLLGWLEGISYLTYTDDAFAQAFK